MQSRQVFILIALLIGAFLGTAEPAKWKDLEYNFPCGVYMHNKLSECYNQTNYEYSELAKSTGNVTILCDGYIAKFKCYLEEICRRCQPEDIKAEEKGLRVVLFKELENPACPDKFNYEGSYCNYLNKTKTEQETTTATTPTLAVITTESATTMPSMEQDNATAATLALNRTKKSANPPASEGMSKPLFRLSVVLGIAIAYMACVACYWIVKVYCLNKRNSAEEPTVDANGNIPIDKL